MDDYVNDEFFIRIRAYSHDKDLMDKILQKPPDYLKKQGEKEAQKEYLKKHVLLEIYERFEFVPASDFEGYVIDF